MERRHYRSQFAILNTLITLGFGCYLFFTAEQSQAADSVSRQAYVITLKNQIPETLIPAIRPLLDSGDDATGFGDELIITTTSNRIDAIRNLVQQLDTPLRNLLITVRSNNQSNSLGQQQGFSGGIKQGDVIIHTGRPVRPLSDGMTVYSDGMAYNTVKKSTTSSSQAEQQIRAVEGSPAFIYTGQSINIPSTDSRGNPYTVEADALQGIYVTARLAGERVIVTLQASNDHFKDRTRSQELVIDTRQLSTTVSGRIGEWINLGGITLGDQRDDKELVKNTTTREQTVGNVSIRIVNVN